MQADDPGTKEGPLPTIAFRVSHETRAALWRRAALRSRAEGRKIKPGRIARELLDYALQATEAGHQDTGLEDLLDEVMASSLFSRRALEVLLADDRELAEKLLRACRAEVQRKKNGRTFLGGMK